MQRGAIRSIWLPSWRLDQRGRGWLQQGWHPYLKPRRVRTLGVRLLGEQAVSTIDSTLYEGGDIHEE